MASNIQSASPTLEKFAQSSNKFSFELHKKLSAQPGNLFYSPLSLSSALAMLYHGTRGISRDEMRRALNYENMTDEEIQKAFKGFLEMSSKDYILDIANSVLIDGKFSVNPEYLDILKVHYEAEAKNVDFQKEGEKAKDEINLWVANKTRNMIQNLIEKIEPDTVLVLLNAVYFKGTWKKQFSKEDTSPGTFYNRGLESAAQSVQMMNLRDASFPYFQSEDFKALEMPYEGGTSMWIILPNQLNGIAELERQFNADLMNKITTGSSAEEINILSIPKFKIEFFVNLNEQLKAMGMCSLFHEADLRGINDERDLCVSDVCHKAFLEVDEEGSEAAAATVLMVCTMSLPVSFCAFVVDHPFLLVIIEKQTGLMLFTGRIDNL